MLLVPEPSQLRRMLVYPDYSQHELGLLAGHVLFTPLWISVLINIPLIRSRNTIPTVEISEDYGTHTPVSTYGK